MYVPNIGMTAGPDSVEFILGATTLKWTYKELGEKGCDIVLMLLKASADERIASIKREESQTTRIIRQITCDSEEVGES